MPLQVKMAHRLRVLAVEDDRDLRHFYETLLGEAGYEVRTAADGGEALAEIEQRRPDIVLLDLMMPRMDGYRFLQEMRSRPEHRSTPVIVLTAALGRGQHRVAGADALLHKPFDIDGLLRAVEVYGHKGGIHRAHALTGTDRPGRLN